MLFCLVYARKVITNFLSIERRIVLDFEQAIIYRSIDEWFYTPQGARVGVAFASEVAEVAKQISGNTLLQLGSFGQNLWLQHLNFRYSWVTTPFVCKNHVAMTASFMELPLDRDSVDCVVAPLCMEAFSKEKNPMDEIDRILKPMGHLILFGINPVSFWGGAFMLRRLVYFGSRKPRLTSSLKIKKDLINRGYEQCFHSSFYYIPPVHGAAMIRYMEVFNEMGKMIWPFPAGFYCLVMQKYQACRPRPVPSSLEARYVLRPTLAPSSYHRKPQNIGGS